MRPLASMKIPLRYPWQLWFYVQLQFYRGEDGPSARSVTMIALGGLTLLGTMGARAALELYFGVKLPVPTSAVGVAGELAIWTGLSALLVGGRDAQDEFQRRMEALPGPTQVRIRVAVIVLVCVGIFASWAAAGTLGNKKYALRHRGHAAHDVRKENTPRRPLALLTATGRGQVA